MAEALIGLVLIGAVFYIYAVIKYIDDYKRWGGKK